MRNEDARSQQAPETAHGVNRDAAGRVVDGESEFQQFDEQRRDDAGDEANEE